MRYLAGIGFGLVAGLLPTLAQEPVVWRDPVHGCVYLLPPQGGIGPRYRPDGLPDCADAPGEDPVATGAVTPQPAPPGQDEADCLLFAAVCVTQGSALGSSRTLAVSGTSLKNSEP